MFSNIELGRLGPGEFFGEMSLLMEQPRSATVIATEATDCFVLLKSDFLTLVSRNPVFEKIVKATSEQRSFELNQKAL